MQTHEPPVKIYSSQSRMRNKKTVLLGLFTEFKQANQLGFILAKRDINAQYRQSILGIFWAFFNPIFNTLLWIFLSHTGVVQVSNTTIPYPAFIFIGTMLWGTFTECVNSPLQQTNASKSILSKINFPPESIIISGVYQILFNSTIKIGLMLVAIFCLGIIPDWRIVLFVLSLLIIIIAGTAIGLILTPIGMLFGDVNRVLPFALQMLMYLTPVVYPAPKTGFLSKIFELNPITVMIENSRNWLTAQNGINLNQFLLNSLLFIILLLIATIIYKIAMPILVERMSS